MKNNKILILLLVVLAAAAIYFFSTKNNGTLGTKADEKSDFAIEDTASIDKIFIADANGQTVTLMKSDNVWMVNGKYIARPDNIRILMKTFSRIDVRSPVPKAAFNNVVKQIATSATKVEIYQGEDKPSKIYYVGGATLDHQGTYMLLETEGVKSSAPFIMYIPGNYGYLSTRFFTEAQQWRNPIVFRYLPEEIKSIEVNYYESPASSFSIKNVDGQFMMYDIGSDKALSVNQDLLNEYVNRYGKIYYEMIDLESSQEAIDSTVSSPPYFSIEVKDFLGGSNKIVAYHMPNFREIMDKTETPYPYDVDRMYGYLNNELFTYIQFATFDKITIPKKYFTSNMQ